MKRTFIYLFIAFCNIAFIYGQHTITIELATDQYGSETTWKVVNQSTNAILASGGPYANLTASGITVQTIAPISVDGTGYYVATIYDSYGDGINAGAGAGYFRVKYDGTQIGAAPSASFSVWNSPSMGTGSPMAADIAVSSLTFSKYQQSSGFFNVTGNVINNGYTSLTSYDVTYTIDGGSAVAVMSATCNLASGEKANFSHNVPVDLTQLSSGEHTIEVTVSNMNGTGDAISTDNVLSKPFRVGSIFVTKRPVIEYFTTENCSNCPQTSPVTASVVNNHPGTIWVSHHDGYFTDQYTIQASTDLLPFYNAGGGTYAPACMVDRTRYYETLGGGAVPGPIFFGFNQNGAALNSATVLSAAKPGVVSVGITGTYNPSTRELSIIVAGEVLVDLYENNLKLTAYITEDNIHSSTQSNGGADYIHHFVLRKALSASSGDAVISANTNGTTYTTNYTFTIPATWDETNLNIVAFVNNWATNVNDREILNAESIDLMSLVDVTGITDAAITAITAPTSGINLTNAEQVTITVKNNGENAITSLDISLKVDGVTAQPEIWNGTIASLATQNITLTNTADLSVAGPHTIDVEINLNGDQYSPNNSQTINVVNTIINGSMTGDFETNVSDFALVFDGWIQHDVDANSSTYGFSGISFLNSGYSGSFIAFAPANTTPAYTTITPHSGNRMGACFAGTSTANNDWLITPQYSILSTDAELSFFVTEATAQYGAERYAVWVSTTGTAVSNFTKISSGNYLTVAGTSWEEKTFSLAAYAGQNIYVAIQCVSNDAFVFFVDDIVVNPGTISITENLATNAINIYPNPSNGFVNIVVSEKSNINVYDVTGKLVDTFKVNARETKVFSQSAGMYFVQVTDIKGNVTTERIVIE